MSIAHVIYQYEALVDKNERYRNRPVDLQLRTFYGQLQQIVVIEFGKSQVLDSETAETIIFAAIQICVDPIAASSGLDLHHYTKMGRVEIVDMTCVQCVVGRIKDPDITNGWVLLDRSGNQARSVFNNE